MVSVRAHRLLEAGMSAILSSTRMNVVHAYRTAKLVFEKRTRHFDVPAEPHFDSESTAYFRKRLESARSYLEYGSGGSTILANKLVNTLVSVDSDAHFLGDVRRKLAQDG